MACPRREASVPDLRFVGLLLGVRLVTHLRPLLCCVVAVVARGLPYLYGRGRGRRRRRRRLPNLFQRGLRSQLGATARYSRCAGDCFEAEAPSNEGRSAKPLTVKPNSSVPLHAARQHSCFSCSPASRSPRRLSFFARLPRQNLCGRYPAGRSQGQGRVHFERTADPQEALDAEQSDRQQAAVNAFDAKAPSIRRQIEREAQGVERIAKIPQRYSQHPDVAPGAATA